MRKKWDQKGLSRQSTNQLIGILEKAKSNILVFSKCKALKKKSKKKKKRNGRSKMSITKEGLKNSTWRTLNFK